MFWSIWEIDDLTGTMHLVDFTMMMRKIYKCATMHDGEDVMGGLTFKFTAMMRI